MPTSYRTILYWRPLVPGLNDSNPHLERAYELHQYADATVFTGLFYRDEIAAYYEANGLPEPFTETARRKIVPETLERRILAVFAHSTSLFRKTSCAVSHVHGLPDYNGHIGIQELCDICPLGQLDRCNQARRVPTLEQLHEVARSLPEARSLQVVSITDEQPSSLACPMSNRATTCNMRSASRSMTYGIRTSLTATAGQISAGRTAGND